MSPSRTRREFDERSEEFNAAVLNVEILRWQRAEIELGEALETVRGKAAYHFRE